MRSSAETILGNVEQGAATVRDLRGGSGDEKRNSDEKLALDKGFDSGAARNGGVERRKAQSKMKL